MIKKFAKKIAVATNVLLFLQLLFFGLTPTTALAATSGSTGAKVSGNYTNAGWDNPNYVNISNNYRAAANSMSDVVTYRDFGFNVPSNATVTGVAVSVEGYTTSTRQIELSLSGNGGTNFSAVNATSLPVGVENEATLVYGGSVDLWGSTWMPNNFSDANFRLRLDATSTGAGPIVYVDQLSVTVYYSVPDVKPTITLGSYTTAPTNQDITVTATTDVGTLNTDSYTFTENGSFDFVATNGTETTTETVTITNIDKESPIISAVNDIVMEATSASGAVVTYTAPTSTDNVDGDLPADCDFVSGSIFPLGVTTVTCSKTDSAGNDATPIQFAITINDTTPSIIEVHGDLTAEASSASGAVVSYTLPSTEDAVDGIGSATCVPAPGTMFAIGDTIVTCNSIDVAGNPSETTTFKVTVKDTTAPVITISDIEVAADPKTNNAIVTYEATATDLVDSSPLIYYSVQPGSSFSLGTTVVYVTAVDSVGNSATKGFKVKVVDKTAPSISVTPASVNTVNKEIKVEFKGNEDLSLYLPGSLVTDPVNVLFTQGTKTFTAVLIKIDTKTYYATIPADTVEAGNTPVNLKATFYDLAGNKTEVDKDIVVDTVAPGKISNLTTTVNNDGHVVLTWTNPTDEDFDGIKVVRDGVVIADITDTTATTYTDTTVEKGKTYTYVVQAYDSAANVNDTTPVTVTVPQDTTVAPTAVAATDGTTLKPDSEESKEVKAETTENTDQKEAGKKNNLPTWGIVLLVVLAGVGGYLFFSNDKSAKPVTQTIRTSKKPTKKKK